MEVNQKSLLRSWLLAHAAGWWSLWEGAALSALSGRGRCGRAVCQGRIALPLPGSAHASFTCLVSLFTLTPQAPSMSSSSAPRAHFCQELVTEFGECVWLMQGRMAAQGSQMQGHARRPGGKLVDSGLACSWCTTCGGCQVLGGAGPRGVEVPGSLAES